MFVYIFSVMGRKDILTLIFSILEQKKNRRHKGHFHYGNLYILWVWHTKKTFIFFWTKWQRYCSPSVAPSYSSLFVTMQNTNNGHLTPIWTSYRGRQFAIIEYCRWTSCAQRFECPQNLAVSLGWKIRQYRQSHLHAR